MYHKILIPVENGKADQAILEHAKRLGRLTGARFVIMHVADGWAARNYDLLNLAESEEIQADRAYLEQVTETFRAEGFTAEWLLEKGEPSERIIAVAQRLEVDLIAMATHGHRLLADLIHGSTADKVRHLVDIPVLLLKANVTSP